MLQTPKIIAVKTLKWITVWKKNAELGKDAKSFAGFSLSRQL